MSIRGLTVSGGKVYQDLDLSEMFGVSFEGEEALKLAVCQEVIDYMRARTLDGKDYNNRAFAKYSKDYVNSDAFAAYNKSESEVNMQLTGDMLASIDFESSGNSVTFLFDDPEDEAKAFGHMSGMEGHPTIKNAPKRLFFGITQEEIESKIMPRFRDDIEALKRVKETVTAGDDQGFISLGDALGLGGGGTGGKTLEELLEGL